MQTCREAHEEDAINYFYNKTSETKFKKQVRMAHLTLVTTERAHLAPVTTGKDLTSIAAARAHLAPP